MAQTAHRSTSRVLDIIELLSASIEGHTLTEIAQLLNSPKSSILPMLQTMAARGFIDLNYRTNRYTIGLGLYFAASIYRNKISVNFDSDFIKFFQISEFIDIKEIVGSKRLVVIV